MRLKEFAERYSLRVKRSPDDGTDNIIGRFAEIYEYGDSELALMLCGGPTGTGRWARVLSKSLAAGMIMRQDGDDEGALSFDPADRKQAALAINVTGARPKRQLSPEHKAKLLAASQHTRFSGRAHGSNWRFDGQNSPWDWGGELNPPENGSWSSKAI